MRLSVIIPVHNGGEDLRRCLEALAASVRPPDEIIVVDDASTDGSAALARSLGARVLSLPDGPHGPAVARNRGAAVAQGDILVFLDADVAVHPDTLTRMERYLTQQPEIAALFGSYDTASPARGLVTGYKNLLHHYVHQHSCREASTFWAGCGAIRHDIFAALGGFDEIYTHPSIEDIELGARLRRAGHRVWLRPDVQVTHLKRWTFASLLRSDIFDRAIPWTRLILHDAHLPSDLNLDVRSRLSALAVWAAFAFLVLGFQLPWALIGMLVAMMALGALNADLYRFFARQGGTGFAIGAVGLHALYFLYSSLTFALIAGRAWLARHGLALVLLVTLFKGLAWSVVIPPWRAPDEPQHFRYGRIIERFQTWRVEPGLWLPKEDQLLSELVQIPAVHDECLPLDLSDRASIAEQVALLEDPTIKQAYIYNENRGFVFLRNFTSFHPPLYYVALAVVQGPLESASILVRILASRWLSVALGVVTVVLAHRAGHELWPGRPGWALLLATLVSFHPMVTFCAAIVGNEVLEIALFSACLLVSLRVARRGLTKRRALALSALLALGLLTKISFLSILPLLGLLIVWHAARLWRESRLGWRALWPWTLTLLLPVLLSGWWYKDAVLSGGNTLISSCGPISKRPDVHLLPYLLRYGWHTIYSSVLDMYWGNFGWLDTPLPRWLLKLLTWMTVIAVWTTGWWLVSQVTSRARQAKTGQTFAMFFLGCATLGFIAFYTYVDFRMARDLGRRFGIQGRYYLPPIIGQMAWLVLGLIQPAPDRLRRVWMWLIGVGMIALNLYALFKVISPCYYGAGDLPVLLERAAVLQPVSATALLAICAAFVALSAALVAALWGASADANLAP